MGNTSIVCHSDDVFAKYREVAVGLCKAVTRHEKQDHRLTTMRWTRQNVCDRKVGRGPRGGNNRAEPRMRVRDHRSRYLRGVVRSLNSAVYLCISFAASPCTSPVLFLLTVPSGEKEKKREKLDAATHANTLISHDRNPIKFIVVMIADLL